MPSTTPLWQQPPPGYSLDCLVGSCAIRTPPDKAPPSAAVATRGAAVDAILAYDLVGLADAVDADESAAITTDCDGVTPLHYAIVQGFFEAIALILARSPTAVFQPSCRDQRHRVAGIAIYKTGGGTALHACVESGGVEEVRAVYEAAAAAGGSDAVARLRSAVDADGHDAATLALMLGRPAALLHALLGDAAPAPWPVAEREERKRAWMLRQRARIDAVCRERERERVAALRASYQPLHAELRAELRSDGASSLLLHPRALAAMGSDDGVAALLAEASHVTPGVVSLPLLSERGCRLLLEEAAHFERTVHGRVARPNSMNANGVVLKEMGLEPLLRRWVDTLVAPLAQRLYDADDAARGPFASLHAFTIRYRRGEDVELSEHADDADLTVNVCLEKAGVEGAMLYFREADGGTTRHDHTVGHAVVHRGSIRHGAEPLRAGTRSNLVVWCRERPSA